MIKLLHRSSKTRSEKAQTMVEFALVFPIILLITYGIIEIGRAVFIYTSITSAAREGARYGAAAGVDESGVLYYRNCDGIRAAVRKTAILTSITDSQIKVWYDHGPGSAAFPTGNICPPGTSVYSQDLPKLGDRLIVQVTVPYSPVIKFLGFNGFTVDAKNGRTILARVPIPYP